jgi:hypothetical protein
MQRRCLLSTKRRRVGGRWKKRKVEVLDVMKRMTAEMMVDEVDRVRVVESERDQRKNKKKETHRDRGQNGKTAEMNMF